MNLESIERALYVLASLLYGFILFTWIVFLVRILNSGQEADVLWAIIPQITVVTAALFAAVYRRPQMYLGFSLLSFFPLGLYLLGGEGLAQLGGMASFIGIAMSTAIFWLHRRRMKLESVLTSS